MALTYQWSLVALSVFIAVLGSYTTLRLVSRLKWASSQSLPFWIAGSALSMGIGIWGMHFVGMLALDLPTPIAFDPTATALSIVPAILASGAGYFVLSRNFLGYWALWAAALLIGAGIAAMHYSGMAAMQMTPPIVYDKPLLALSVLIAVVASRAALYLIAQERANSAFPVLRRVGASIAMGLAVSGMHYMGMWAAEFAPGSVCTTAANAIGADTVGMVVVVLVLLILGGSLALTFFDEAAGEKAFHKTLLAAQSDAGEGVAVIENGRIIYANAAMETISGHTSQALAEISPWQQLLATPDSFEIAAPYSDKQLLSLGRTEVVFSQPSGKKVICEARLTQFRHGEKPRHLLICFDVSNKKEAEEKLRIKEILAQELALVAANTDQGVIIMNAQRHITWVNEGFTHMTGFGLPEVLGRLPREFLHGPLTDPASLERLRAGFATGETFKMDIVHYRKDGGHFWSSLDILPVRDGNGEIFKYISMERDITDRKRINRELALSESRLKEAQTIARLGYWEGDLLSDKASLSDQALQILEMVAPDGRCSRADLLTRIHPDDRRKLVPDGLESVSKFETFVIAVRLLFAQERIKHVELRLSVQPNLRGEMTRIVGTVQDITEQRLAEQSLRASESEARELALIAAGTDNAVFFLDPEWNITWVNDSFVKTSGYTLGEVRGKRPSDVLNGEETDLSLLALMREKLARRERFEFELIHYKKGGEKYWVVIDIQAVLDKAGRVVKYISIERDITSRKLAEADLRLSEARLKEAQQLAHIGSWEYKVNDDYSIVSEEFLRIHELTSSTGRVPRSTLIDFVHPDDLQTFLDARAQAANLRSGYSVELRLLFPQGRVKHVQLRGSVHTDASGNVAAMVGTMQDITELKQSELALLSLNQTLEARVAQRTFELDQQREFTETVLNTAVHLIFVVDSRGYFVRFNAACERLCGYTFDEVQNRPVWDLVIPPERREEVRLKHENQTDPKKVIPHIEVVWLTRSGERRLISWTNGVILDPSGKLAYMIGTGIDITDQKRSELALVTANQHLTQSLSALRATQSQLVQAEKMASLGSLVAGISHEINTPIGVGFTAATALQEQFVTLRRDFEAGTMKRSDLQHFIGQGLAGYEILVSNLMRAAELIRSFKQVAVDQSSDAWRQVNLHDYLNEILLSLQPSLKGRPVEVINAMPEALTVYTHPGAIYQIVSNLLMNSLIHAYEPSQKGTIRISARQVDREVHLDYADDGKGIPASIQKHVFDPFFTTRRGAGGSGLGLHIVFNLVTSTLQGHIYLAESTDKGALFKMRFPLKTEE